MKKTTQIFPKKGPATEKATHHLKKLDPIRENRNNIRIHPERNYLKLDKIREK